MHNGRGHGRSPSGPGPGGTTWRGLDRNTSGPRPQRVCHQYRRGRCSYGGRCKFLHAEDGASTENSSPGTSGSDIDIGDQYFVFKKELRRRTGDISRAWNLAITILDGPDHDRHHAVARDLADDETNGLSFVGQTIEVCMGTRDSSAGGEKQVAVGRLFLQTITHHSLVNSLSVEGYLGTIYRFIAGGTGDRAIGLFTTLLDSAQRLSVGLEPITILSTTALHQILRRERKCLLSDDVTNLLNLLETCITSVQEGAAPGRVDVASIQLRAMKRMVQCARGVLVEPATSPASGTTGYSLARSTFPLPMVIPGGNHDNDFSDFTKIGIFPTLGEITNVNPEFLPTTDFSQPHFLTDPVQRHLDSAFRLLRHDIFGPMKDAVGSLLRQQNVGGRGQDTRLVESNLRAHIYPGALVQHLAVPEHGFGLQAVLSFAPLRQLHKRSMADRRRWWKESSRLQPGGLVCLVSCEGEDRHFLPLVVSAKSMEDRGGNPKSCSLVDQVLNPSITARLVNETQETVALLLKLFLEQRKGLLVDMPGIIPETFTPILLNLQRMMREGSLAFQNWILPLENHSPPQSQGHNTSIPPPVYARKEGFHFDLGVISKKGARHLSLNPALPGNIDLSALEVATGLDEGQCQALIHALTREYALIQGPPGTGKSYVGVQLLRVLLKHKREAALGPTIIICYTNHALDQFLSHLMAVGIDRVIRIGGQSRTEALDGKNLRVVRRQELKTTIEDDILNKGRGGIEKSFKKAQSCLSAIEMTREGQMDWEVLGPYLSSEHPLIAAQFTSEDDEGFTVVGGDPLEVWLRGGGDRTTRNWRSEDQHTDFETLLRQADEDIHSLAPYDRRALVEGWSMQMVADNTDEISDRLQEAKGYRERMEQVFADIDRRALMKADVVGVTTTGLARNINTLQSLGSKVVVCEEAAEVMEPHILSALFQGVEHFIQIGDHQQLRPQIQNYGFSMETPEGSAYQLDRSQFERRAVGEPGLAPVPVAQLKIQRRMRPEISSLIRRVYPKLRDHETVHTYPGVTGMRHFLFWLDHQHPEDVTGDSSRVKSHSNSWEVSMATALVRHLVKQGKYDSTDIALLTPYTGQLQKLRSALSADFEVFLSDRDLEKLAEDGVVGEEEAHPQNTGKKLLEKKKLLQKIRLATVDNFQGEEAKVVVVSLVRSNDNRKVGFLRTENRINVLLSRAQHGLYLLGNAKTYQNVEMWADVYQQLHERNVVGPSIALCCPRHPETSIECTEPQDFSRLSPEGGCALICDQRLDPCGHRCPEPCHAKALHDVFMCLQPCPRIRATCHHPCSKLCGESCGACTVKVPGMELPCGHLSEELVCYQTLKLETIKCRHLVEKYVPSCGHTIKVPCCTEVSLKSFRCPVRCEEVLVCGDPCPGSCGDCRKPDENDVVIFEHQKCERICGLRSPACNHLCARACHNGEACGRCDQQCQVRCPHSQCPKECHRPCDPCIEPCVWYCEHRGHCSLPCAAPCDRLPCDRRCSRLLDCGHECPSYCGEVCPQHLCQLCCRIELKEARVDLLEFKTYTEVDLNDSPIAVLGCGHFFTGETLDGMLGMAEVYTTDGLGEYNGLHDLSGALSVAVPSCPDCRVPIRQFGTRRYNRVVNRAVMDETVKRFMMDGSERLKALQSRWNAARGLLPNPKQPVPVAVTPDRADDFFRRRYAMLNGVRGAVHLLRQEMRDENNPVRKLFDAIVTKQRQQTMTLLERQMHVLNLMDGRTPPPPTTPPAPVYNRQVSLEADTLHLQVRETVLYDKISLWGHQETLRTLMKPELCLDKDVAEFLLDCLRVVTEAHAAKLPRLVITVTLAYARVAQLMTWYRRQVSADERPSQEQDTKTLGPDLKDPTATARKLLGEALELCGTFPDGKNYRPQLEETARLFDTTWYEEVTPEEIEAIKQAMVSGPWGINTHSGHWYHCENGHPFTIGECGMPMELAICPECGASIGGTNHTAVAGVTRATNME
ncbi:putative zinc-finger and helicase domain-containing protein [Cercophora samala]|uniref:Zinc-finger and helicase domain-containing protein n=1 Tax=Cercophora samala TaxID=330535 RepID=A0AA40D8L1_9PEZI|nr:putative zinc-finger and helicase domain-containing protein [Cercophora samala]